MAGLWQAVKELQVRVAKLEGKKPKPDNNEKVAAKASVKK